MTIEEIVEATRQQLAATLAARDNAQRVVDSFSDEVTRLQRALNALEPQAKKSTKTKAKGKKVKISEAVIDRVRHVVEKSDHPLLVADIIPQVGVSQSSVNAALNALREREVIRLAGKMPTQGGPNLWAPMKRS